MNRHACFLLRKLGPSSLRRLCISSRCRDARQTTVHQSAAAALAGTIREAAFCGAGPQPHVLGRPPVRIATLSRLELRRRTRSHPFMKGIVSLCCVRCYHQSHTHPSAFMISVEIKRIKPHRAASQSRQRPVGRFGRNQVFQTAPSAMQVIKSARIKNRRQWKELLISPLISRSSTPFTICRERSRVMGTTFDFVFDFKPSTHPSHRSSGI